MKIIIPMAGVGKRMRPHTLTIPKPLIKIAGKPIVERLVDTIINNTKQKVDEIAFVIGNFGKDVEKILVNMAEQKGAKGRIYYQQEALGTAHAIHCASQSITGKIIVAFADTLFHTNTIINDEAEGVIWVNKVDDPCQFGVVMTDQNMNITGFVEKPKEPISNLAIIGIYYFKDGKNFQKELQYLIDNNIMKYGEYQITDVLQNMLAKKCKFIIQEVQEWLDCGNKDATVNTNKQILKYNNNNNYISKNLKNIHSIIVEPCYIGENVEINNSIIGPYVSIGNNTKIENSIITNSIIQENSHLVNANIDNSMIGNHVEYKELYKELNIGDFTTIS